MAPRYLRRIRWPFFAAELTGESMKPLYRDGDWVVVLRTERVRAGAVIAVRDPRCPQRVLIKRAIRREISGWWVEGDNPIQSTDSRTFGPVSQDLVVGRVLLRYYPLRRSASAN